jgi:hypothetical protein
MAEGLQRQNCINHPDRYGHAVCMSCRKTLCQECATEWDGIFHCARCLSTRRRTVRSGTSAFGWISIAAAALFLFWVGPKVMIWATTIYLRAGN